MFDFAPTRALCQLRDYAIGLLPNESNLEGAVKDLVSFLPVLAYDGAHMTQIDAGGILDIAMAGTSATGSLMPLRSFHFGGGGLPASDFLPTAFCSVPVTPDFVPSPTALPARPTPLPRALPAATGCPSLMS